MIVTTILRSMKIPGCHGEKESDLFVDVKLLRYSWALVFNIPYFLYLQHSEEM